MRAGIGVIGVVPLEDDSHDGGELGDICKTGEEEGMLGVGGVTGMRNIARIVLNVLVSVCAIRLS